MEFIEKAGEHQPGLNTQDAPLRMQMFLVYIVTTAGSTFLLPRLFLPDWPGRSAYKVVFSESVAGPMS